MKTISDLRKAKQLKDFLIDNEFSKDDLIGKQKLNKKAITLISLIVLFTVLTLYTVGTLIFGSSSSSLEALPSSGISAVALESSENSKQYSFSEAKNAINQHFTFGRPDQNVNFRNAKKSMEADFSFGMQKPLSLFSLSDVTSTVSDVSHAVSDTADSISETASEIGHTASDVSNIGSTVKDAVSSAVNSTVDSVKSSIDKTADSVGKAVSSTGEAAKEALNPHSGSSSSSSSQNT